MLSVSDVNKSKNKKIDLEIDFGMEVFKKLIRFAQQVLGAFST